MNRNDSRVASLRELRAVRQRNYEHLALLRKRIMGEYASLKKQLSISGYILKRLFELFR